MHRWFCLFGWTALWALQGQQAQVGTFANIRPGASMKAEVDLSLGEPVRKLEDNVYEYAAPRAMADTARVVASFFPDSRQVSRLDVYVKVPLDPELLRSQFGTRVLSRSRDGGQTEELYYPKLNALILDASRAAAPVTAISYLSPRLMADVFAARAQKLRSEKRFDEAQTEADKAVLVDPDYALGYLQQGDAWLDAKNENEAIVSFIAAAKARYSARYKAAAHTRLGIIYSRRKWADKAAVEFQQAVAVAPDLDEAHGRYGEFLREQKQPDQAAAELSTAVRLNSGNIRAHNELAALYYARSQFVQALPHSAVVSRWAETPASTNSDASKAEWHYRYGVCLSRQKQSVEAIEVLRKAVQRNPRMIAAWLQLAQEQAAARDFPKALESLQSGLQTNPQDLQLNRALGSTLLESGQADAARRQMEATLRLQPNDPAQRFDLGRCWAALGKKKQALHWIQEAVSAGFKDRARLTSDRFLAPLQKDGDFKKILQQVS